MEDRGSIAGKCNDGICSLRHRVQIGSGANPASYQMGTEGSYHGGKAAGV